MIRKIVATITGGTPIVLRGEHGDFKRTILYKTPFSDLYCYSDWIFREGKQLLEEDGSVSSSKYAWERFVEWKEG